LVAPSQIDEARQPSLALIQEVRGLQICDHVSNAAPLIADSCGAIWTLPDVAMFSIPNAVMKFVLPVGGGRVRGLAVFEDDLYAGTN